MNFQKISIQLLIIPIIMILSANASAAGISAQKSVFFIGNNGWSCGAEGDIWHTANAGKTWKKQDSGTDSPIDAIYFIDKYNGWAISSTWDEKWVSYLLHTTNGGTTWVKERQLSDKLRDIFFLDNDNGWLITGNYAVSKILHTSNGGKTWEEQNNPSGEVLNSITFTDRYNGWACGQNGTIMYTYNGGKTWSMQNAMTITSFNKIFFKDVKHGWAVGDRGIILFSSDGGRQWRLQSAGTQNDILNIYFTDSNTGWLVTQRGYIYSTSNGGFKWSLMIKIYAEVNGVFFTNPSEGYLASSDGLLKTFDGGTNWQYL